MLDKPRDEFFNLLRAAFEAMWDGNTVRITSVPKPGGDKEITTIEVVPRGYPSPIQPYHFQDINNIGITFEQTSREIEDFATKIVAERSK